MLLHLVRRLYPTTPAVFCDTGLEFPEIRNYIGTWKNVTWIHPKKSFKDVITRYGYPVISKQIARSVSDLRNGKNNQKTRELILTGGKFPGYKFPEKWKFLLDAPFPISNKCCDIIKHQPFQAYERLTGRYPMVGLLAIESQQRLSRYLQHPCNIYDARHPISSPLSIWSETDIWRYLHEYNIPVATCYEQGWTRTGCIFCLFGIQYDETPNRLQRLKETHPRQYQQAIQTYHLNMVMDYLGLPYR